MDEAWHEQVGRREEWEAEAEEARLKMQEKRIEEDRLYLLRKGIGFKEKE